MSGAEPGGNCKTSLAQTICLPYLRPSPDPPCRNCARGADHPEKLVLLAANCSFGLLNNIGISHFLKVDLLMAVSQ